MLIDAQVIKKSKHTRLPLASMISLLCVDDEPAMLDLIKLYLERYGEFAVTTASSAAEALDLFRDRSFDAIVSDYEMEGQNGVEFLGRLRGQGNTTPIILLNGECRENVVVSARTAVLTFGL